MIGRFIEGPSESIAGQKVAIVAFMMFVFFYGLFIDAASFIYSAEILPTNIRSSGVAMATTTYFVSCITFVTPGATAIANIGYKYFVRMSRYASVIRALANMYSLRMPHPCLSDRRLFHVPRDEWKIARRIGSALWRPRHCPTHRCDGRAATANGHGYQDGDDH